jgi:hypothetical protein
MCTHIKKPNFSVKIELHELTSITILIFWNESKESNEVAVNVTASIRIQVGNKTNGFSEKIKEKSME